LLVIIRARPSSLIRAVTMTMPAAMKKAAAVLAIAATVLADSACTDGMTPSQVRMAYHGADGMAISWNTKAKLSNPTVMYGTGDPVHSASSSISITYPTSQLYNNHVVITGLQHDTRYHYQVQCDHRSYSFTTSMSAGQSESFSFAVVGDMGTFGPDGLSTTVGKGAANPLKPGDMTSMQSLHDHKTGFDFVWHGA
jgi:acid phosphatase type 7